jgi:hypothetical protein
VLVLAKVTVGLLLLLMARVPAPAKPLVLYTFTVPFKVNVWLAELASRLSVAGFTIVKVFALPKVNERQLNVADASIRIFPLKFNVPVKDPWVNVTGLVPSPTRKVPTTVNGLVPL